MYGPLQWGQDIRFNNEFKTKKWDFIAKAQDEGSVDRKLLKGDIGSYILTEGRPRWSDITRGDGEQWETWLDIKGDQI